MGKKAPMLESLFNRVAGPETYDFIPVAATDYIELYNLVSNTNGTSYVKENYPNFVRN